MMTDKQGAAVMLIFLFIIVVVFLALREPQPPKPPPPQIVSESYGRRIIKMDDCKILQVRALGGDWRSIAMDCEEAK